MLSFKALSEKKTKVTLNPKLKDVMEKKCDKCGEESCECDTKKKKCPECNGKGCKHCGGTGYHDGEGGENESMEEQAYVSQEEVSEESNQESETETLLTFRQFNEGRAEDAKASLEKIKARQKVLDAHEKKTGKKLDINKSVEARAHKKNFPGAKRTGKKVKGAKETPSETQNRRINKATERIVKRGYTSKEKKEVKAMAKHTSRYD